MLRQPGRPRRLLSNSSPKGSCQPAFPTTGWTNQRISSICWWMQNWRRARARRAAWCSREGSHSSPAGRKTAPKPSRTSDLPCQLLMGLFLRWGRGNMSGSGNRNVGALLAIAPAAWEETTYATSTYWRYRGQRALPYGGHDRHRGGYSTDALWRAERCDHHRQGRRRLYGLLAPSRARASHQSDGDTGACQYLGAQKPGSRMGDLGQCRGEP